METKRLILFDGVCVFCNGAVNFIIKRDKQSRFVFASLQSPLGQAMVLKYGLHNKPDTFALINDHNCLTMSDAAINVAQQFGGLWSWISILKVFPKGLRDYCYNFFGRHRYRMFGKLDSCLVPTPELKARFVGDSNDRQW